MEHEVDEFERTGKTSIVTSTAMKLLRTSSFTKFAFATSSGE